MGWLLRAASTATAIFALLVPNATQAQTRSRKNASPQKASAASTTRWPIQKLRVEGNQRLPSEPILKAAGLQVGQLAGKEDFEAARDRLIASGMFETVGYQFAPSPKGPGYDAGFQVVEVKQVYPVRFEALSLTDSEIEDYLKEHNPLYRPELPGTKSVLDQYARRIETLLASKNHPDKVVGELVSAGANQLEILFRSATTLPAISEVTFEGNESVLSRELQRAISGVAFGVPFTKQGFRQLLDSQIRPRYDAVGMVRVSFPKVTTSPAAKVKGVDVHVVVNEGPVYKLGKVALSGGPADESANLQKIAAIKAGDVANFDDVNQGVDRLRKSLRRNGYLRADVDIERKIDDAKKTVDVLLKIDPAPQFRFGKLAIEGLDLNGEPAIRKLWGMKEGAPFDANYPNHFLDRIREDGLFDNLGDTKAVNDIHEDSHTADVTLKFSGSGPAKERKPGRAGPYLN
ncbi:MAG: POTRA domain-containing protein [Bryobacteraceae bacterium]